MRWAVVLTGASACLIEPTPGFGTDESSAGTSAPTSGGSSANDDGITSSVDDSGTSTGDGPQPLPLPPRGYQQRACGFDFDHDGEVAEPDECSICDGATEDPDGDGFAQPIYYVDCGAGVDPVAGTDDACLDPGAPCKTIDRALAMIPTAPDLFDDQGVVCFTGVCTGRVGMPSGEPMIATRPAQGIEVRAFDYPARPTMLIGWDTDADGEYPPFDEDDEAILRPVSDGWAIELDYGSYSTPTHDVELAHFAIQADAAGTAGLLRGQLSVTQPHERIVLHDLEVEGLRAGTGPAETSVVQLTMQEYDDESSQYAHLALENLRIAGYGGYLLNEHADLEADPSGPIRIANLTTESSSCDRSVCDTAATSSVVRIGGWFEGVEILASIFDAKTESWYPYEGGDPLRDPGPTAIHVGECSSDVAIVDNAFIGWATAVRVAGNGASDTYTNEGLTPCNGRDTSGIRVEGNFVHDSSERLAGASVAFVLQTAPADEDVGDDRTLGDVRLVNNAVVADYGVLGCAWVQVWGAGAGPIVLAHDTCIAEITDLVPTPDAALLRVVAPRGGALDPLGDLRARALLFAGTLPGNVAMATEYAPSGWSSDEHVLDEAAMLRWNGGAPVDLAAWRSASGQDGSSVACAPAFFAPSDFHLAADDTCAADAASPLPGITHDIDGDPRPVDAPWDVGADQRAP
jgi:hypothetical protein